MVDTERKKQEMMDNVVMEIEKKKSLSFKCVKTQCVIPRKKDPPRCHLGSRDVRIKQVKQYTRTKYYNKGRKM